MGPGERLSTGEYRVSARGVRLILVEPDNLENRVSSLETQVSGLTGRVGACERDVAVFVGEFRDFRRATVGGFNAMREDFTALRTEVTTLRTEMDRGFAEMDRGFAEMDRGFTEIRGRLDGTAAGLAHIADLIENLSGT